MEENTAEEPSLGAPQSTLTVAITNTQKSAEWWRPTSTEAWMPFFLPQDFQALTVATHLEGISITHKFPRRHLWSYVVGDVANPTSSRTDSCPCTAKGTTSDVPIVIGSDYYCSSGNNGTTDLSSVVRSQYPLWRTYGPSCVPGSTCCDNPDQPWFKKTLTQPASENVEMRWCAGEQPTSEATATTRVELYIRVDNAC